MAVWLTKDNEVILIGDKVYTGSTNPCGYAYLQKCTYKEGTATSAPTNTAELTTVRVAKFCTYTNATEWFNQNSSTYPTSGATSYTLLNSQLSGTESAAGWLTCADKSRIELGTCSYNPQIYYVHSRCDCTAGKETGTTKATITTSSVNSSYDTHEGPFVYTEAKTKYNALNNKSCTCADYLYVVVGSSCNCDAERWTTSVQYYRKGSSYTGTGTILAGPFETEAEANTANGQIYPCTCQWYFAWDCQSLCGSQDGGTLTYRVYGPSTTPYNASSYDGVSGPYSSKAAVEAAMAEYEKKTCTCPDLKWYVHKRCISYKIYTSITNSETPPSGYEYTGKSFDLKEDAVAYANSIDGTECGVSWTVFIYLDPTKVACKYVKAEKQSNTEDPEELRAVYNARTSDWAPYEPAVWGERYNWWTEDEADAFISTHTPTCGMPGYHCDSKYGSSYRYLPICYCNNGSEYTSIYQFDPWTCVPAMSATSWFKTYKLYNPAAIRICTCSDSDGYNGYCYSSYGCTVTCSGTCTSTASLLLSDTPDDLQ